MSQDDEWGAMMSIYSAIRTTIVVSGAALAGCTYIGPHSDTMAKQRYDTYAPKYTAAQKADMSQEQKVAEYNKHARPQDQVVCRRQPVVGTHFRKVVCTTPQEQEEAQVAAQDFLRAARTTYVRLDRSDIRSKSNARQTPNLCVR